MMREANRFLSRHPELWIVAASLGLLLLRGCGHRLRRPVLIFGVDDDARRSVVIRLHHFAFVQRHPFAAWAAEAVTADGKRAFPFLQFCACAEQV